MEENKDYNPSQYEDDDRMEAPKSAKSIRGYQTIIVILAVILAALSILYFNIHRQQQEEYDLLLVDRDSIKSNLSHLMEDFDNLQISNDSISQSLGLERSRADSLMERLTKERSWSYAKIKKYEKEIGTMRTIMRGYLRQIDSLNTLNKNLIKENVSYRKEISSANLRAEVAEEKASELSTKVRQGAVIRARGIRLVPLNARDKEVSRVKNASRLRVEFTLAGNDLAEPGERTVYVRITSPDGYVQSNASAATFEFEVERLTYTASRDVDYQNEDLAVGVYYNDGAGFTAGTYRVEVYADGRLAGQSDIVLR